MLLLKTLRESEFLHLLPLSFYLLVAIALTYSPLFIIPFITALIGQRNLPLAQTLALHCIVILLAHFQIAFLILPLVLYTNTAYLALLYISFVSGNHEITVATIVAFVLRNWQKHQQELFLTQVRAEKQEALLFAASQEAVFIIEQSGTNIFRLNQKAKQLVKKQLRKQIKDVSELVTDADRSDLIKLLQRTNGSQQPQELKLVLRCENNRKSRQKEQFSLVAMAVKSDLFGKKVQLKIQSIWDSRKKHQTQQRFVQYLGEITLVVNSRLMNQFKGLIYGGSDQALQKMALAVTQNHHIEVVVRQLQDLLSQQDFDLKSKTSFKLRKVVSQSIDMIMNRYYSSIRQFSLEVEESEDLELVGNYLRLQFMVQLIVDLILDVQKTKNKFKPGFKMAILLQKSIVEGHLLQINLEFTKGTTCLSDYQNYFKLFDKRPSLSWEDLCHKSAKQIGINTLANHLCKQKWLFNLRRREGQDQIYIQFNWLFKHLQQMLVVKSKRLNLQLDFTPRVTHDKCTATFSSTSKNAKILNQAFDPSQVLTPAVSFKREKNVWTWEERLVPKEIIKEADQPSLPEHIRKKIDQMVASDLPRILQRLNQPVGAQQPLSMLSSRMFQTCVPTRKRNSKQLRNTRTWKLKKQ